MSKSNRNKCCIEISNTFLFKKNCQSRTETSVVLKFFLTGNRGFISLLSNRNKCCIEISYALEILAVYRVEPKQVLY